ncbi:MAG: HlyD family type I secretion periplasmic adaptor subunit [bacterium]|nr:HlyD family type I secretion periplasmic adaptor subunit [bacterium]
MSVDPEKIEKGAIRRYLGAGVIALFLLIGGIGGWSAYASINGAVIASGAVVQDSKNKRIQHGDGGIIRKIHVKDGTRVHRGELLISLDDTRVRAELDMVRKRLFELKVRRQRLRASRDGKTDFKVDQTLSRQAKGDTNLNSVLSVQQRLFKTTQRRIHNQKQQLRERIAQLKKEISGFKMQVKAKSGALKLSNREIRGLKTLHRRKLVSLQRLNSLIRTKNEIESDLGRFTSEIANAGGRISEAQLKIIEIEESQSSDVLKELEKIEGDILELRERYITANDRLNRLEIRSPQEGYVHELQYFTLDGVIQAGETLMHIVPDSDQLTVEARILPTDVDQITIGQKANIRFTAFNQRTTPMVAGKVTFLAPDQSQNEKTDEAFFKIRIGISSKEQQKIEGKEITPGMPAEVMIRTSERTVISYLMKPLFDQFNRAFRED